jgi:hypothetical protein
MERKQALKKAKEVLKFMGAVCEMPSCYNYPRKEVEQALADIIEEN